MADISDNFNRSNGSLGANWTTVSGQQSLAISSNIVVGNNLALAAAAYNTQPGSAEQWAQATISHSGTLDAIYAGILLRAKSTELTAYFVWQRSNVSQIRIIRWKNGEWNFPGDLTHTYAQGMVLKAKAETIDASTVRITVYVDGDEIGHIDDTHADRITDENYCGICFSSSGCAGGDRGTIDDFSGGELGGDPPAATFIPRVTMF